MADHTINITSQPSCRAVPPSQPAKKETDRIRWHALTTDACIDFPKKKDWPFEESYDDNNPISLERGDNSDWFTPVEMGTFSYGGGCAICSPDKPLSNGLSATIIISE